MLANSTNQGSTLTRVQIRRIFRANFGAASQIARELGVTATTISLWLSGRVKSARIEAAMRQRAEELLRDSA